LQFRRRPERRAVATAAPATRARESGVNAGWLETDPEADFWPAARRAGRRSNVSELHPGGEET